MLGKRRILVVGSIAAALTLAAGYCVILLVVELARLPTVPLSVLAAPSSAGHSEIPLKEYIFGTVLVCAVSFWMYAGFLRKSMLAGRRLSYLANVSGYASGQTGLLIRGPLFLIAAALLFLASASAGKPSMTSLWTTYLLLLCYASSVTIHVMHLQDYRLVSVFFAKLAQSQLAETITSIREITKGRLKSVKGGLPDRLQDINTLEKRIQDLLTHLTALKSSPTASRPAHRSSGPTDPAAFQNAAPVQGSDLLIERHGDVALLFHPDYLPHLSHIYLKLSQLRALNMPPRRIQLLGRRWTLRGLESEYILVHDISEHRREFTEDQDAGLEPLRHLFLKVITSISSSLGDNSGSPDQRMERAMQASATIEEATRLIEMLHIPEWRKRSLKKRGAVVVAPDGALLEIAIEEERQFNI